jgi:hypothetical protein
MEIQDTGFKGGAAHHVDAAESRLIQRRADGQHGFRLHPVCPERLLAIAQCFLVDLQFFHRTPREYAVILLIFA